MDLVNVSLTMDELNFVIQCVRDNRLVRALFIERKLKEIRHEALNRPEMTPEPMEAPETEADVDDNDDDGSSDDSSVGSSDNDFNSFYPSGIST
jgi:hypothetical protein